MRTLISLILLGLAPTAFAQDKVWAAAETPSVRFADAETAGPTFNADDELVVLVRDGDRLRVARGTRMGWIPAPPVTDVAPVKDVVVPGLESLDMGSLEDMLKMPALPAPTPGE